LEIKENKRQLSEYNHKNIVSRFLFKMHFLFILSH